MTRRKAAALEPMQSLGYLTRINFRAFSRALERLIEPYGISSGQWRFLRVLWEEDGLTQKGLSERVGITEATTAKSIVSLEDAGFITRKADAGDGRKVRVHLTAHGRRLKKRVMPLVVQVNEQALAGLSAEEVRITRRVLAQTYRNLS